MDAKDRLKTEVFAAEIRWETVKQIAKRGFGHLAGSLSIADALAVLYDREMRYDPKNPTWPDRDILVCSKGHAGPAVYSTLALKGFFPMEMLDTLNQHGTKLPSHCDRMLTPGIDMTTGSLGQGVSAAIGMALAQKLDGKDSRTYIFIGDGECDEGQVWEAFLFANQYKLDNVVAFIDDNGKQLDGYTKDVIDLGDLREKLASFGWNTVTVDGHDLEAIDEALQNARKFKGKPSCIVLKTVKGKGVKELEEMYINHHIRPEASFFVRAEEETRLHMEALQKELAKLRQGGK